MLTEEQILSGKYGIIHNEAGNKLILQKDGSYVSEDTSAPGSGYAKVASNAMVHAFAQGSNGIGARLMRTYGATGKLLTRLPMPSV